MNTTINKPTPKAKQLPNRLLYIVFVITAIVFICVKDYSTALIFGGVALVFDPFNTKQPFNQRPLWQRIWLIVHIIAVFAVIVLTVKK
jgi:hypothetical protein